MTAARRTVFLLGLACGCFPDAAALLRATNVTLTLEGIPAGAAAGRVELLASDGGRFVREPQLGGTSSLALRVGPVSQGTAQVSAAALGADGAVIGCAEVDIQVGAAAVSVSVPFLARAACSSSVTGGSGACEPVAATEVSCGDGLDDDCNSQIDCADEACLGATRACADGTCAGEQTCHASGWGMCTGAGAKPEANRNACRDGQDNDCDGKTDCDDPDCRACTNCDCP